MQIGGYILSGKAEMQGGLGIDLGLIQGQYQRGDGERGNPADHGI